MITPLFSQTLYSAWVTVPDLTWSQQDYLQYSQLSQSRHRQILSCSEFSGLLADIQQHLDHMFWHELAAVRTCRLAISQSWINRYRSGESQPRHWHSNSVFSGVVMLQDHEAAMILYTAQRSSYQWSNSVQTVLNSTSWRLPTERGRIYVMPSTLDHETETVQGSDRYTLAFDCQISGDTGSDVQGLDTVAAARNFSLDGDRT